MIAHGDAPDFTPYLRRFLYAEYERRGRRVRVERKVLAQCRAEADAKAQKMSMGGRVEFITEEGELTTEDT